MEIDTDRLRLREFKTTDWQAVHEYAKDPTDAQGVVGYCLNKNFWRQGYGGEACKAVVAFGFSNFKLHRVYATCDADNTGSAAVLRKVGMRQEAHFRQNVLQKGEWRDTLLFAILQSEWEHQPRDA